MAVLGDTKAISLTLLDGVIGDLNPKTTTTYNLGTSSLKWNNIYGTLKGNADTATKATQDESGNNIKATYAASISISNRVITLSNKNGTSLGTVTIPDDGITTSANANRAAYYSTTTTIDDASSIYMDTSHVTINGTSTPANSGSFQVIGTSTMRDILPQTNGSYDLGSTDALRWHSGFFTTSLRVGAIGTTTSQSDGTKNAYIGSGGVYLNGYDVNEVGFYLRYKGVNQATLLTNVIGTTTAAGTTTLTLGNDKDSTTDANSNGTLKLFGNTTKYTSIKSSLEITGNHLNYLPVYSTTGTGSYYGRLVGIYKGTSAGSTGFSDVGSTSQPVYVTANGVVKAITGAIANDTTGNATTATTASKLSNTSKIGDTNLPVYFTASGVPAAVTASSTASNLLSNLPTWTAAPTDDTYFVRRDTNGSASYGQVKWSTMASAIAEAKSTTLAWNTTSTIATIGGHDIKVTLPAAPTPSSVGASPSARHFYTSDNIGTTYYVPLNTTFSTSNVWITGHIQVNNYNGSDGNSTTYFPGRIDFAVRWRTNDSYADGYYHDPMNLIDDLKFLVSAQDANGKRTPYISFSNKVKYARYYFTVWLNDSPQTNLALAKPSTTPTVDSTKTLVATKKGTILSQVTGTSSNTNYYLVGVTGANSTSGPYALYKAYNSSGSANSAGVYFNGSTGVLMGAAWNDYAEFRKSYQNIDIEPGRVVKEVGDDTLELVNARLQRGCQIVSDTYGFGIGESKSNKLPLAVSGRVLAYPYESLNDFRECIGWPVCSGPNGTVSIMTEEEERDYPSRIIGTISAVPDYEIWHGGTDVAVNGRVWIKVR